MNTANDQQNVVVNAGSGSPNYLAYNGKSMLTHRF